MKESEVRINFADGSHIIDWLRFSMRESFTDPLGSFEFTVAPPRARILEYYNRLAKGQLVTLLIDGVSQGGFLVQSRTTGITKAGGIELSMRCASPLSTPYEGAAGELTTAGWLKPRTMKSQTDTSVGDIVFDTFQPYGFSQVLGQDFVFNASAKAGKTIKGNNGTVVVEALKSQEAQSQDGEAAYAFASRIFKRFGVVLHIDIDGGLYLTAPDYSQASLYGVCQTFGESVAGHDRLLDVTIEETNDDQFSQVIVRGVRKDGVGETGAAHPVASVTAAEFNPNHPPYTSDVAAYKPFYFVDKNARDVERCRAVATLLMGIRAANSYVLSGTVSGLRSVTGAIWSVNTCVDVRVDAIGLTEKMWILSREMTGSKEEGQRTKLTIIPTGNLKLGEIPSG